MNTSKKEKIMFILSCRASRELMSDETYKDLYIFYKDNLNNDEIDTEFDFYLNDKSSEIYPSLDTKLF